ncbi:MAG: hypothetical protein KJZ85_14465 [Rhodobacteraceae bacterium]|nr:hypothetical protein [Paracoccaceae bacterium]
MHHARRLAPPPAAIPLAPRGTAWLAAVFAAGAVGRGGIVRRAVRHVEREVGRPAFEAAVRARGFHLVECGGQFVVICNTGRMTLIC